MRRASGNEIEIADEQQQIRFIVDDLGRQAQLVAIKEHADTATRYALLGRNAPTYRLAPYRSPGSTEAGNWEFAYCERAEAEAPAPNAVVGDTLVDAGSLEIVRNPEATQAFPRRRGRVQRWDDYLRRTVQGELRKTDLDACISRSRFSLVLEMAYAAADIFPVEIVSKAPDPQSDQYITRLVSRNDIERAKLSDLLGLEAPAVRLAKMLDADEDREEGAEGGPLLRWPDQPTTWNVPRRFKFHPHNPRTGGAEGRASLSWRTR